MISKCAGLAKCTLKHLHITLNLGLICFFASAYYLIPKKFFNSAKKNLISDLEFWSGIPCEMLK